MAAAEDDLFPFGSLIIRDAQREVGWLGLGGTEATVRRSGAGASRKNSQQPGRRAICGGGELILLDRNRPADVSDRHAEQGYRVVGIELCLRMGWPHTGKCEGGQQRRYGLEQNLRTARYCQA